MFTVTDIAAEKAKEVLTAEGKAEWGLRVFFSGSGCCGPSFGMDLEESPKDGDEIIEHNGLKVFADQNTAGHIKGMSIDFIDDGQQQGFIIKGQAEQPPSCGCSDKTCP
jgi:iron-sulfur cluster assembly accessory protein